LTVKAWFRFRDDLEWHVLPGATVTVDRVGSGQTGYEGTAYFTLKPGGYLVRVTAPWGEESAKYVVVQAGESIVEEFRFVSPLSREEAERMARERGGPGPYRPKPAIT